jgi:hypothetical protein
MEDSLRKIYEDHASLLRFLTESGVAAPPALAIAANFALNASLRRAIEADNFDPAEIEALLARAAADQVTLDTAVLSFAAGQRMKRAMVSLEAAADADRAMMTALRTALAAIATRPARHALRRQPLAGAEHLERPLPPQRQELLVKRVETRLQKLGEALYINVDQLVIDEGVSAF